MFPNSYFILQSLPLLSDWIAEFKFLTFLVHVGPGAWPGGRGEPSRTPRPVTGRRSQGEHCSDNTLSTLPSKPRTCTYFGDTFSFVQYTSEV